MLRLIVPKHVEFNNFRLQVFFNVLQISTLVLLTIRFFEARLWVRSMDIGREMSADLWVKPGSTERISEVWQEQSARPVCTSPERFDFLWGGEDGVAYAGHECLPPCGSAGAAAWPRCVREVEMHRREADDQVFFVTQLEERLIAADGSSESSFAFVPIEEAHTMGLQYGYSVPYPWWPGSFSAAQLQSKMPTFENLVARSDGYGALGTEHMLTVLVDSKGDVHRVVEPTPTLDIPLPELLELAGERDAMESPNVALGRNWNAEAQHPEGGIGRITGVNIDLHIECFQSQKEALPGRDRWTGPVCYAKAERSPTKSWASWETVEAVGTDGSIRQRLHHGVRARVIMEGHVDVFDANSLFLQLTASLVFLALPGQFMYFFINYTLGHLSTIYQGVLIELFDIQMECARLTARLMSNSVTFVELEDVSPDSGSVGCISRNRVEEQLREVLRYRGATLDEEEIAGVVHFCHQAVMRSETLCRRVKPLKQAIGAIMDGSAFRKAKTLASKSSLDLQVQDIDPGVITIDSFSMCCAASSQMEFESFVRLFDKDRGVTVLEKFFLPPKLKPSTLISGGRQFSVSTRERPRQSLFNLHDRHAAQIAVLKEVRHQSSHHPDHHHDLHTDHHLDPHHLDLHHEEVLARSFSSPQPDSRAGHNTQVNGSPSLEVLESDVSLNTQVLESPRNGRSFPVVPSG